jgi:hypothetical protein
MDDMSFASSLRCKMHHRWVYHEALAGKWIRGGSRNGAVVKRQMKGYGSTRFTAILKFGWIQIARQLGVDSMGKQSEVEAVQIRP